MIDTTTTRCDDDTVIVRGLSRVLDDPNLEPDHYDLQVRVGEHEWTVCVTRSGADECDVHYSNEAGCLPTDGGIMHSSPWDMVGNALLTVLCNQRMKDEGRARHDRG